MSLPAYSISLYTMFRLGAFCETANLVPIPIPSICAPAFSMSAMLYSSRLELTRIFRKSVPVSLKCWRANFDNSTKSPLSIRMPRILIFFSFRNFAAILAAFSIPFFESNVSTRRTAFCP